MCRVLSVARSGWYAWRNRHPQLNPRKQFHPQCDAVFSQAFRQVKQRYGAPRITDELFVHSDRGGQYCSADYRGLLKQHGLLGSMSAKGCCYDNACAESFFHTLEVECIHGEHLISR